MSVGQKILAHRTLRRPGESTWDSVLPPRRRRAFAGRGAKARQSLGRLFGRYHALLLIGFSLAVVALCAPFDRLAAAFDDIHSLWMVVGAAGLYGLSHVGRAMRLAILAASALNVSVRTVFLLHFHTAPVSYIAPFKLGELYRWQQLMSLSRDPVGAVVTIVLERMLDAIVLLGFLALFVWVEGEPPPESGLLAALLVAATAIGLFAVLVAPGCLNAIQRYILTHHSQPRARRVLRFVDSTRSVTESANARMKGNFALLLTLSCAIWALESGVLLLLALQADHLTSASLASFLSMTLNPRMESESGIMLTELYSLVSLTTLMVIWPVATALYVRRVRLPRRELGNAQQRLAFSPARRLHIGTTRIRL